jgi:hypothetical protein
MLAAQYSTIDTRLGIWASACEPILLWPAPLLKIPAKHFLVKFHGAFRIIRRKFKMDYSRHGNAPLVFGFLK